MVFSFKNFEYFFTIQYTFFTIYIFFYNIYIYIYTIYFYNIQDLRQQKYKHKHLSKTRVLKVKNITLELENDFKPINISVNDTNKFEKKK